MHALPLFPLALLGFVLPLANASPKITDIFPDKARYAPGEAVHLLVELKEPLSPKEMVTVSLLDLDRELGQCQSTTPRAESHSLEFSCTPPSEDYHGYLALVRLVSTDGKVREEKTTAVDVSSDWKRFPRYGYLAHYNKDEGADPHNWVETLNRFHINGLQFYDFQYRHDQPLAGSVSQPAEQWKDIAGREVDRALVLDFISQAHRYGMKAMAYNASYSAYDDVFTRQENPLPLAWATWSSPEGERTAQTAKSFDLHAPGWSTSKLFYMNQNHLQWQQYLFGKMKDLFAAYPFDGWHIDTFGEKAAFSYDRSRVDYIAGFPSFINNAHAALRRPVLFNAVNTWGQERIAQSEAEFVYSELWEDHETFASILESAEQVHTANPGKAYVLAAYVHRRETKDGPVPEAKEFNPSAVLLTDAAIFASGAAHIELGDGQRLLSSEYFPADTKLNVSPQLIESLRRYYDFMTAYETYLRDGVSQAAVDLKIEGYPSSPFAVPETIWTISRKRGKIRVIHLINLLGSNDPHWRDIQVARPDAPRLNNLEVSLELPQEIHWAGWASPDIDGGRFHSLAIKKNSRGANSISLTLPELHYWDCIFLQ